MRRDVALYARGVGNLRRTTSNAVVDRLWDLVTEAARRAPLAVALAAAELDRSHWARLFEILGEPCPPDLNFSLEQLWRAGLADAEADVFDVCRSAQAATAAREARRCLDGLIGRLEGDIGSDGDP